MLARILIGGLLLGVAPLLGKAQVIDEYLGDDSRFYAETKQVNQFMRRFNGEEDASGKRYYPENPQYRDEEIRRKYLPILFNNRDGNMDNKLKSRFIKEIINHDYYLDFHGGNWFAEVQTIFRYEGKSQPATLFMKLEEAPVGSKWIFTHAWFKPFAESFTASEEEAEKFLHPLSHELEFMNLRKIMDDPEALEAYTASNYQPDYLSILLYAMKNGEASFQKVTHVRFHFFQVEGWYFALSRFNRDGYNTGWLISDLVQTNRDEKDLLKKFLYYEQF